MSAIRIAACSALLLALACEERQIEIADASSIACSGNTCITNPPVPGAGEAEDGGANVSDGMCDVDKECDDGAFCNGVERCNDHRCVPALAPPCTACDESLRRCDCDLDRDGEWAWFCSGTDDDADGDGVSAEQLGGDDCDDSDSDRFKGHPERCDYRGHDEDCDPTSVAGDPAVDMLADKDLDQVVDVQCINIDRATGTQYPLDKRTADCDDDVDEAHPGAGEDCDGIDNDCDGWVDELPGSDRSYSAQFDFCRDADGDGASVHHDVIRRCGAAEGYILCRFDQAEDCNDLDEHIEPQTPELCDGVDTNCDGRSELNDERVELASRPMLNDTEFVCDTDHWVIATCPKDRLWCDRSTIATGCATDATRLRSCRQCESDCAFSCGQQGCAEITQIALGFDYACARTSEGEAVCWGRGAEGRLGNDDNRSSAIARKVIGSMATTDIAVGSSHACLLAGTNGAVYCWGNNRYGQLANPDAGDFGSAPLPVPGMGTRQLANVVRLAAGGRHSCAVLATGHVTCWGDQTGGLLGNGRSDASVEAPRSVVRLVADPDFGTVGMVVDDARDIGLGQEHGCLVNVAGDVECWGSNASGQLGVNPSTLESNTPVLVPGLHDVTQLALGQVHSCALSHGIVYCWGANDQLQLGRASSDRDHVPTQVAGLDSVSAITAGSGFTCALSDAKSVYCWGANATAQLGTPDGRASQKPVRLPLSGVKQLVAGGGFACFVSTDGRAACWGSNSHGQLGRGASSLDASPVATTIHALFEQRE